MNEAIYIFGGVFVLVVVFYFLNLRRSGTQHGTMPKRSGDQPSSRNQESDSKPGPARSQIEDLPGGAKMEAPNKRLGDQPSSRNQESDSKPEPTRSQIEDLPGGAKMAFVYIPAGTFTMGSPSNEAGRLDNEGPQHQVTISKGFYLGKNVVTQWQWEAVMGTAPWTAPWSGDEYVQINPNHPAVYVSWDDAQAFVRKLNAAAGKPLYRLPTEAEWEYACRAGTTTRWSFGGDESKLGDYAWYDVNAWDVGNKYAHAVGTKLPNPWGLYDMHGNVWEWAQDWYGDYTSTAKVDPTGPSSGSARVDRGGGFASNAQDTRSAGRDDNSPSGRASNLGFRLLRIE